MVRVLVVGAGISGLACAFDLARGGQDVTVLEAGSEVGGVVGSVQVDGFHFENGPNTVQSTARHFRGLAGDLGIADRLIVSRSEAKVRFLYHRGRLVPLPRGPFSFLFSPLLSVAAKWHILTEGFRNYEHVRDDDIEPNFETFLRGRIGAEATRRLAGAFVRGVYAAEIDQLGARSAFPRLWSLVNDSGGLLRGVRTAFRTMRREVLPGPQTMRGDLLSFSSGLGELPRCIARELGDRMRTGVRVTALARQGSGWSVTTDGGENLAAERVVLAVSAPVAHSLLAPLVGNGPGSLHVASLTGINHAAVTLVHLGLRRSAAAAGSGPVLPPGFGFLVPPDESREAPQWGVPSALGTLFVSNLFSGRAPEGDAAVTSFYRTEDVVNEDEHTLRARALRDLVLATGQPNAAEVVASRIQRWENVIPRYGVGHARIVDDLCATVASALPGLALAGNYTGGVSVDDCIARGRAVAEDILAQETTR